MPPISVTRTYLQLTSRDQLHPVPLDRRVRLERAVGMTVPFFRFLYAEVGRRYHWRDRLAWSDEQCAARVGDPAVQFWVLYADGVPAGYFELERHADGAVEIVYFGLLPEFVGRSLGKQMLSAAAEAAWKMDATRVWLHTCTLDNPAALPNYLKRGFAPFKTETYTVASAHPAAHVTDSPPPA
ncbi:MAG TPA: GNAT family N-acetyltransferase [Gemmatimonadaceae bacterium]|nr:GNAT family N-acetyltransferase [Gemmatimonadaceae bacterium]